LHGRQPEKSSPNSSDEAAFLHKSLWGIELTSLLLEVRIGSQPFKYLPKENIVAMRLNDLRFPEDVLLFRPEYEIASDLLKQWSRDGSGGVAVIGQPGIGKISFR